MGNKNKTFQEDDHEYYELCNREVNENSHSSKQDNSEADGPNHSQSAIAETIEPNECGIIIQENGHEKQDEGARSDSKCGEILTPHVRSISHEYDIPPDARELIEAQSSDTALYENFQSEIGETRSDELPVEDFKGDENLNGSTKPQFVSRPDEENPDALYSHISTSEQ